MKNKSFFSQIITLIILILVCIALTVGLALLAGSYNAVIFNFKNLNLANMIPVLIFGTFVSFVIIGISMLFIARSIFLKLKKYLSKNNKTGGNKK